jgi:hypothetical protein
MRIVEVEWTDAHSLDSSWFDPDDLDDSHRIIHSVGYVVETTEAHLTLVQSLDLSTGLMDHGIAIPIGMVRAIRPVTV